VSVRRTPAMRLGLGSGPSTPGRLPDDARDLTAIPRGCQPDRSRAARPPRRTRWRDLSLGRFLRARILFIGIVREADRAPTRRPRVPRGSSRDGDRSIASGPAARLRSPPRRVSWVEIVAVARAGEDDRRIARHLFPSSDVPAILAVRCGSHARGRHLSLQDGKGRGRSAGSRPGQEMQRWVRAFAPRSSWPWPGCCSR
jgi:hypothetical protein